MLSAAEYDSLFPGLRPELVAHAEYRLHDHDSAEDVASGTYLRGREYLRTFDGQNLRAWLLTICNNLCHEALHARMREQPTSPDQMPPPPEREGYAEVLERYFCHLQTHSDLTPKQSRALRLRAQGYSQQEIARRLLVSQPAVAKLLRRAEVRAWRNFRAWWPGLQPRQRVTVYRAILKLGVALANEKLRRMR